MMPAQNLEPLMTAEDVAAFLKISVSGVYRLRAKGELPGVPVGSLWRWNPEVVRAYARGERPPPGSPSVVPLSGRRRRV